MNEQDPRASGGPPGRRRRRRRPGTPRPALDAGRSERGPTPAGRPEPPARRPPPFPRPPAGGRDPRRGQPPAGPGGPRGLGIRHRPPLPALPPRPARPAGPPPWERPIGPTPPPLPPPEHGIRARRFGTTWWGQRWLGALERFSDEFRHRLFRGQTYARQGRVHDLAVDHGVVRAQVTGTRPEPYDVTVRVIPLSDATWERAIRAMARKAVFTARLLAGEMPRHIDQAFHAARASLFPARPEDLETACSCPDWANPCKHVAAVHYVLGEFFDRDPFLLFELRGRSRDDVLAALRQVRATGRPVAAPGDAERAPRLGGVVLRDLSPEAYGAFRTPVRDLRFRIEPPPLEGAVLRQLGKPSSWRAPVAPVEVLHPVVAQAAALARELALSGEVERPEE